MNKRPTTSSALLAHPDYPHVRARRASSYTYEQLATIYNQGRVDYIVPMPMNARRMQEYCHQYDIDLAASLVALGDGDEPMGVGMLGLRDERCWITRLGIMPHCRGRKVGQFLVEMLLRQGIERGASIAQLEVIQGNDPAHHLFLKFGFEHTRDLIVIRRPPGPPVGTLPLAEVTTLNEAAIAECLAARPERGTWIDENASLYNVDGLEGLRATLNTGDTGTIVFRNTVFQLSHFVINTTPDNAYFIALALLAAVHRRYPNRDTKIENLPANSILWRAYQQLGYVESFRRIEMMRQL